ncbi:MAG: hypothetical protein JWL82_402, partial [Parcubacteria group bacterium]|nr:hypothetical protein [Parcubacteria group bacterium]
AHYPEAEEFLFMNQGSMTAQIARWTVLVSLFVIPFLPLFVANSLFFPFITGKAFAFRILVEVAFAGYLVLALAEPKYRPRFSWTFALYGAFILWILLADVLGANPHKALWSNFERMEGWVTLIHVFLFFVVSGAVFSADALWNKWWLTFAGGSALVSAYCLLQLSGAITIHQGGVRVDGTFGNAAYLAAYLLFAIAITLWQALQSRGWLRYILLVLAALQIIIVFFTATRGAILGLVGAAFAGTILWMIESGKESRKVAIGILVGLVVVVGGFILIKDTNFVKSEPTLARISSISVKDLSTRSTLWHMALKGVAERPLTGWGQEGYNFIFNKYYEPSLYAQEPWFDRAHNVFFDWLVAGGIPGLLLFLGAFGMAIRALYRGGAAKEERVLLIAALAAYAIQGIVVFDNLFSYIPLAAILATAHGVSSRPYKRLEKVVAMEETVLQVAAPIVLVLALITVWVVNVPNIAAASELVHAITITSNDITPNVVLFQKALGESAFAHQEIREQLVIFTSNVASQQQGTSSALSQLTSFALSEMGKEVASQPQDARLRLEYALGFRIAGDYQEALKQIQLAHEISPKKQSILLEEGIDYWQIGDFASASKSFDAAYALDTSFTGVAAYAAAGDIASGDVARGKALLESAFGTTTVNNEPVILAYYQAKDMPDLVLVLEQQVRDENGSAQSRFRLAAAYVAAKRYNDARAAIAAAVAAHPEVAAQGVEFAKHIPK